MGKEIDLDGGVPPWNGEKLSRCRSGEEIQLVPRSVFMLLLVAKLVISNFQHPELLTSFQERTTKSWTEYE